LDNVTIHSELSVTLMCIIWWWLRTAAKNSWNNFMYIHTRATNCN